VNDHIRHRKVFQLEALEDRLSLSAPPGGPGTAWLQVPAEHGPSAAEVRVLQGQDTGGPGSRRRQALNARRLDRAFVGFDRAIANLDQATDRLERAGSTNQGAAVRVFNRAVATTLRAEAQLNQAFVTGTTAVQDANRARLQRALDDLGRLDDRIDQLLERLRDQPPSSGLGAEARRAGR
jgi:hypothetical protein